MFDNTFLVLACVGAVVTAAYHPPLRLPRLYELRRHLARLARDPDIRHATSEIAAGLGFAMLCLAIAGWYAVLGGHP